jgi:hypothetical protein
MARCGQPVATHSRSNAYAQPVQGAYVQPAAAMYAQLRWPQPAAPAPVVIKETMIREVPAKPAPRPRTVVHHTYARNDYYARHRARHRSRTTSASAPAP